ncbi:GerMN domain-containing protein [Glutamicibacter arilaitensis]|uniref:GerMN domain-containing protein n=1 Tax=Glutamicibacter arilaitensis TaxID=256701 RepID=UPI00384AFE11
MPISSAAATMGLPPANDSVEHHSSIDRLPIYWLENMDQGVFLYREYATKNATGEPIGDSISYLLNEKPANSVWYTHLKPTSEIGVSMNQDNVITLDLPEKVFSAKLDQGLSERTIQQLVFTASAAASNAGLFVGALPPKVRILVDGRANATVFGDLRLADSYERDASFMAPIWIIDPQHGSTFKAGQVHFTGRASNFTDGIYYSLESKDKSGKLTVLTADDRIPADTVSSDGSFEFDKQLSVGSYKLTFWGKESGSEDKIAPVSSEFSIK